MGTSHMMSVCHLDGVKPSSKMGATRCCVNCHLVMLLQLARVITLINFL